MSAAPGSASTKSPRRWLRPLVGWTIAVVFLGYLGWRLVEQHRQLGGLPLRVGAASGAALLCMMLAQACVGATTHAALRALHGSARASAIIQIYLLSQAAKYLPLGGVLNLAAQTTGVARRAGLSAPHSAAAVALSSATVCAAGATAYGLSMLAAPAAPLSWLAIGALPSVLLVAAWPYVWTRTAGRVLARLAPSDAHAPPRRGALLSMGGFALLAWVLFGASLTLLTSEYRAVDARLALQLAGIMAGSWVVGFLSVVVPAGLGVRDALMLWMLQPLLAAPLPVVLPLVSRLAWLAADLLNFAIALLWLRLDSRAAPPPLSSG